MFKTTRQKITYSVYSCYSVSQKVNKQLKKYGYSVSKKQTRNQFYFTS